MPRFEVTLEAQDGSGHFRRTRLEAESKAAAKLACEHMEMKRTLFTINNELAETILTGAGVEVEGTGPEGAVTRDDLLAALDTLPKPAKFGAPDEERAPFREFDTPTRSRLHAHFQEQPYKITSVKEVK